MERFLSHFLQQHRLPGSFSQTATEFYIPLATWLRDKLGSKPFVLGINGTQGSGKSTLADFIKQYLENFHSLNVASLSIDDIYLTRAEREQLAEQVHPLLKTRGAPGTHDIAMGAAVIESLKKLGKGEKLPIPRFDKSSDDRFQDRFWDSCTGPVDLIIFEGWCVGSIAASPDTLIEPQNKLESEEDPDGRWRTYANQQLFQNYPKLFDMIDALVLLKAPSFECVYEWRLEQERKLADSLAAVTGNDVSGIMSDEEIARFIQHYERITRNNIEQLPEHADVVLELSEDRQITAAIYPAI